MKISTFLILLSISFLNLAAQQLQVKESSIEVDSITVAFYKRTVNNLLPRYDFIVFNEEQQVLIEAKARIYPAPVEELRAFYYYDIVFPGTKDSISVFFDGTLFIEHLAFFIKEYGLIKNGRIDEQAQNRFLEVYDQKDIIAQLEKRVAFFRDRRFMDAQVKRNRTSKVEIRSNRTIFQDGIKVGYIIRDSTNMRYTSQLEVYTSSGVLVGFRKKDGFELTTRADDVRHTAPEIYDRRVMMGKDPSEDDQLLQLAEYLIRKYYL